MAHATLAVYSTRTRRRRRSSWVFAGRCPERWQQCWWGRERSPCRPVRRPPRAVPWSRRTRPGPLVRATPTSIRRQRWLRRPALRPRPHLHAAGARPGAACRPAERCGDDRPGGQAWPGPIQSRFAWPGRAGDHRQREAGQRGGAARCRRRGRGRGLLAGAGRRGPHLGARSSPAPRSSRGRRRVSSSPTAVRPPGRPTSRASSTAG